MAPHHQNSVVFYLYTEDIDSFKVVLTTEHYKLGPKLSTDIVLSRLKDESYRLHPKYHYATGLGLKWTFRFVGPTMFGITVLMEESSESAATFVALPVSSWGRKYYAVTLRHVPTLQIIANQQARVLLDISLHGAERDQASHFVQFLNIRLKHGDRKTLHLNRYEAYDISSCDNFKSSLSGTKITSDVPVGAVSGSCRTSFYELHVNCSYTHSSLDIAAEMLPPVQTFGRQFITPKLYQRQSRGSYVVISSHHNTLVQYVDDHGVSRDIALPFAGDVVELTFRQHPRLIQATKAIAMYFVQHSTCQPTRASRYELGDVSLMLLVPLQLFYFQYTFRVPGVRFVENYILIVITSIHRNSLLLDEEYLSRRLDWDNVWGAESYSEGALKIYDGVHSIQTTDKAVFGCYVYSLRYRYSYMHPAGYRVMRINRECERDELSEGDNDTNDECDESVIKELDKISEEDNDVNGLKLSPLKSMDDFEQQQSGPMARLATVSEWSPWHCAQDCNQNKLIRTRQCSHYDIRKKPVCKEPLIEEGQPEACYVREMCPAKCPSFTWGLNCYQNCSKCYQPCNKFNGTCSQCKAGYKNAKYGCNQSCGLFEFGQDCTGNCLTKCDGEDCYDRVTGECNTSKIYFVVIFLLALVIPCCAVLCSGKSKSYSFAEDVEFNEGPAFDTMLNIQEQERSTI
ncbi:semaphorin-5A [Biomphalaria pfeifferi]|uniref:Semaphorin-5A n=1 Tax=Biomphalaria pfeifferi TaxID=112525 RepID=A0AAD8BXP0_BIOPF|nr:semaphorin-5A [Biomphalaria pfeifferi]